VPRGDVATFHEDGWWYNRIEGGKALGRHDTREEAVTAGRAEATRRKVEHIVHNRDGTIGERNSDGDDPRDVPG
jgi:hypothetical protein